MATSPPTGSLRGTVVPGAVTPGVAPWAAFTSQTREHVPELRGQRKYETYERMLTDAQVWGLYSGWVIPAEAYDWWVDPNGNDLGRVRELAQGLGAPIGPPEDRLGEPEETSLPEEFDLGDLLHEAFFAPVFGNYYFNWSFDVEGALYRIAELAPLHPTTISEIRSDPAGRLQWIRQAGTAQGFTRNALQGPPRLQPHELIPFVYWPDARRRWEGRSLLRPLYRNWLCKDVLIRVDVTNHERAGGVPWIETDERYAGNDLEDLARLASEFRVDEEGGAALPPGALLRLAKVAGSDTVGSIEYHDRQMSFAWHEMVRNLGSTPNGSRALGDTFADLETLARRALAEWARRNVNRWIMARVWDWNYGERTPPVLRFTPPAIEAEAANNRRSPDEEPPGGVGDPPPQAATARPSSRHKRAGAAARPSFTTVAAAAGRATVPERELRRQPYEHEVAAAVDFAAIEAAYEDAAARLESLFLTEWLPEQVAAIVEAIEGMDEITAAGLSTLRAPVVGVDALVEILGELAANGAAEAVEEVGAQGEAVEAAEDLAELVADHAQAVAQHIADGVSIAASRRAVQLVGSGLSPSEHAAEVSTYLTGLEHRWERDQLAGAAQQALNAGRLEVFDAVEASATAYASELLDAATCAACRAIDGTEYASVAEARRDYPTGGYRDCHGGPRCRGTVVLVLAGETEYGSETIVD